MSWTLTVADLPDLARGATLLGTGGGGDPYIGKMLVERVLGDGSITVLDPDDLADDLFVIPTAQMGAPTVMIEKIPAGFEPTLALRTLEDHLGRRADATMPIECGGINSMIPLVVAAETGLPVVDADGMGRAFPELHHETFHVYGVSGSPMVVTDDAGSQVVIETADNRAMEWLARGVTVRMGGVAYIADYAMDGATAKRVSIGGTIGVCAKIGAAIRHAREHHLDPFDHLVAALADTTYAPARPIFSGKVVEVFRRTVEGFVRGVVAIAESGARDGTAGRRMEIEFQNENLVARVDGEVVAIVPNLICVLDADTAEPITTEELRYGQRVTVMAVSVPEIMRTPAALAVWGPRAFGYDIDFAPLA